MNLLTVHYEITQLPAHIRRAIDGIKVKQQFDEEGNVCGQTVELKMVPKATALDMAMKHLGLYELDNDQRKQIMALDWESLLNEPEDVDVIEARLVKEEGKKK